MPFKGSTMQFDYAHAAHKPDEAAESNTDIEQFLRGSTKNLSQTWTCPLTKSTYIHKCPATTCPANLAHLAPTQPSGCVFNLLPKRRTSLDLVDLSYAFNLTEDESRKQYDTGLKNFASFLTFYRWLNTIRDEATTEQHHCWRCGITKKTSGHCLNVNKCDQRKKIGQRLLERYPCYIPDLKIDLIDIWGMWRAPIHITTEHGDFTPAQLLNVPPRIEELMNSLLVLPKQERKQ